MAEIFPNLVKEADIQIQEVQGIPKKMYPKNPKPRRIMIRMPIVKSTRILQNFQIGNRNQ